MRNLERNARGQDYDSRKNHLRIVPWRPSLRGSPTGWRCADAPQNSRRVHSGTPELSAGKTRLWKVFGDAKWDSCPFVYVYDFGDHWDHSIKLVGREPSTGAFICKEGGGHGAAEDVGSDQGWLKLIQAYRASSLGREQKDKMRWFEQSCRNGDLMGLKGREGECDMAKVNRALGKITI
ncbi:hypothetical protein BJ170DRAFT_473305 [Xylariales sp. AK1849]|nr:hypothetical protein BJ170DRAFT_473305 [Xylariales sp. AK1849]